uniref:SET domain-containing protein n=1 Tax=Elaeophora elaphi TaxID=1147741 RepID=A0A0R3RIU0_9BILA
MRWENQINVALRANGQEIFYIHNDVDYTRRRRNFKRFYKLWNEYFIVECYGCRCCGDCLTKLIQNGRRYKVAIVRTETSGWGVFALENIASNVFVVEYVGEVIVFFFFDSSIYQFDSIYQFELNGNNGTKYLIDAKYRNEAAFINHSCNPNLVAVRVLTERFDPVFHRIGFFSKCPISRGFPEDTAKIPSYFVHFIWLRSARELSFCF